MVRGLLTPDWNAFCMLTELKLVNAAPSIERDAKTNLDKVCVEGMGVGTGVDEFEELEMTLLESLSSIWRHIISSSTDDVSAQVAVVQAARTIAKI